MEPTSKSILTVFQVIISYEAFAMKLYKLASDLCCQSAVVGMLSYSEYPKHHFGKWSVALLFKIAADPELHHSY